MGNRFVHDFAVGPQQQAEDAANQVSASVNLQQVTPVLEDWYNQRGTYAGAQAAFQNFVRHGGSQASGLMMNADPLEFHGCAVQKETLVRIETEGAKAKGGGRFVGRPICSAEAALESVKRRRPGGPQLRAGEARKQTASHSLNL